MQIRLNGIYGTIVATSAAPQIADVTADQDQRALFITGRAIGTTVITVKDDRGFVTRDVPVRVAYAAGNAADQIAIRVTGRPATTTFLREAAATAAQRSATLRQGASVQIYPDTLNVSGNLDVDNRTAIDVPVQIAGDGYITVNATTHVEIENVALPNIQPARLLVSDYPETLGANGVLFSADLDRSAAQRFLYYHYNPGNQPSRRILLRAANPSSQPATVQFISGSAGPETNEMEVGHLSTQRFLVRELQNEGSVVTIPPQSTINLVDHALPPGNVVSALLQLREIDGNPVHLTLVAQDASAPLDQSVDTTRLLSGGVAHARGEYQVPQFYFDYSYDIGGDNLEIPIGQLPLPNLRQGEALAGDYGVQQAVTVTIVNSGNGAAPIAIYANPRGGRATGTFLIDRTLVQTHAVPAFSRYKIWQETIAAHTFRRVQVITMPEGGSSYPLRLVFAPDDGSVPPNAPGSPVY
ncbi:MAG: pilus assembly protein N-terminal domain-containing protein [Candidatus Velthaea sp.]